MSSAVIKIENLWKEYRLGVIGHGTLTHDLQSWWAKVRGKEDPNAKIAPMLAGQEKQIEGDRFWALRDINLKVKEGEILGIIGKNGAGKSTLLKILSRVTAPTKGSIKIKGRIASLLEVGTGFHPELTGRENIFMNGAILGMSKQEIKTKLDEIIDFSGVEDFIDTPVKRYSSGMYVRLAFAVAAHLEPEILVVDEVLAVGDAEFQKKCLGKMKDVAGQGRTVLFVSHNMAAVQMLCTQGAVFHSGRLYYTGTQHQAVSAYLSDRDITKKTLLSRNDRFGSGEIQIEKIQFVGDTGEVLETAISGQKLRIQLYYKKRSKRLFPRLIASISVKTLSLNIPVFLIHSRLTQDNVSPVAEQGYFELIISRLPLPSSIYCIGYSLMEDGGFVDAIDDAVELEVKFGDFFGSGEIPPITHGVCLVEGNWSCRQN